MCTYDWFYLAYFVQLLSTFGILVIKYITFFTFAHEEIGWPIVVA